MLDQTPITWVDGVTALSDDTFNTEIRNAYSLLLNPPACQVHRSTTQTITAGGGWQAISWDTEVFDTEDPATPMWAVGSPTRITIRTAGYYYVNGDVGIGNAEATSNNNNMAVRVNGTTYYNLSTSRAPSDRTLYTTGSSLINVSASNYLELMISQTRPTNSTLSIRDHIPLFTVIRWRGQ